MNNTALSPRLGPKLAWVFLRNDEYDAANLMVEGVTKAVVTLQASTAETGTAGFISTLADGRKIGVFPDFKSACLRAMSEVGVMTLIPAPVSQHFENQFRILKEAPACSFEQMRTPKKRFDVTDKSPLIDQLCDLLDELSTARLATVMDVSNQWPVVLTLGSYRPDLLDRVQEMLEIAGYEEG